MRPPGIPSIRQIQEAGTIRLKEILVHDHEVTSAPSGTRENKRRDWLNLLLRETLGWFKFTDHEIIASLLIVKLI